MKQDAVEHEPLPDVMPDLNGDGRMGQNELK